jgi:hypothetical protein
VTRWIVRGVMFVALVAGVFGLLPRLGGLTRDAAGLRHARPAFVAAAVVAQALSLGCYALPYRQVLASLGARLRVRMAAACWSNPPQAWWLSVKVSVEWE